MLSDIFMINIVLSRIWLTQKIASAQIIEIMP